MTYFVLSGMSNLNSSNQSFNPYVANTLNTRTWL